MQFEVGIAEEIWTAKYRFRPAGGGGDADYQATAARVAWSRLSTPDVTTAPP